MQALEQIIEKNKTKNLPSQKYGGIESNRALARKVGMYQVSSRFSDNYHYNSRALEPWELKALGYE